MSTAEQSGSAPQLDAAKIPSLAQRFVEFLNAGAGFRHGVKAGMALVYLAGEGVSFEHQRDFVGSAREIFSALAPVERDNFAAGLAEAREYLETREPGRRTMGALSVWEQIVAELPTAQEHRARAGQNL